MKVRFDDQILMFVADSFEVGHDLVMMEDLFAFRVHGNAPYTSVMFDPDKPVQYLNTLQYHSGGRRTSGP